jgi:NAD(P)-dependent dehydrogenase (short-subunit alcohol dehydrogenase family)
MDSDVLAIQMDVFDRTVLVNLGGHLLCARPALPELLKRGGGSIVYTSSAAAFVGEAQRPAYGISKSGLGGLVRHVASRWGKEGVRANGVAPGLVLTDKVVSNPYSGTRGTPRASPAHRGSAAPMTLPPPSRS